MSIHEASVEMKEPTDTQAEEELFREDPKINETEICPEANTDSAQQEGDVSEQAEQPRSLSHKDLGRRGEQAAASYLERRGFYIYDRNWTCTAGEADIVAEEDGVLVFIEVKTRSNAEKGFPEEAVDARKRNRYESIAGYYLSEHDFVDKAVRFDVISILVVGENSAFLRHHRYAFSVNY